MARKNNSSFVSNKKEVSNRITFTGTMHAIDFEVMYRIKLKRICKGYSQQETAFLLGKSKDYISIRERFGSKKSYTAGEIGDLSLILDCESPSFLPRNPHKDGYNMYIGQEIRANGKIYHEARIKGKGAKSTELIFKLEEDDPEVIDFPDSEQLQLARLKILLFALCEIGFFTGTKTPWQVFYHCSRLLTHYISPRLIEQVVNHFIKERKINKVIKDGYIVYKSAASNKIKEFS